MRESFNYSDPEEVTEAYIEYMETLHRKGLDRLIVNPVKWQAVMAWASDPESKFTVEKIDHEGN